MDSIQKLNLGNEIVIRTKDGQIFEGIFVNIEKGYLSFVPKRPRYQMLSKFKEM